MKYSVEVFPLFLVKPELGHTSPKPAPDETSEQTIQSKQLWKRDKKLGKKMFRNSFSAEFSV